MNVTLKFQIERSVSFFIHLFEKSIIKFYQQKVKEEKDHCYIK